MEPESSFAMGLMQQQIKMMAAHIAELEAKIRAPWHSAIRTELAGDAYKDAVAAKDAAAVFALLLAPGDLVLLDPITVEHIRAVLSEIAFQAEMHEEQAIRERWLSIVDRQTQLLIGVTVVPRSRVVGLQRAAVTSGVLASNYQIGETNPSALERMGCADIVTHAEHIVLAMGWGQDSGQLSRAESVEALIP